MSRVLQYVFIICIAFSWPSRSSFLYAQDRCGTVPYSRTLHRDDDLHKVRFEAWLQQQARRSQTGRQKAASYKIPVVVHVIHNGEAIGVGANISDDQIRSQIRVLNEDFQRLNADTVDTPPEFATLAASVDLQFVLAKQDPDGMPSSGIVRVNGGRPSWTMNDNYALKELSYWPAEEYMNLWVCNLTGSFVGYAQFPESDLEGLENASMNRLTDGVVIWYKAFGSAADGAFNLDPVFDRGRTATHETGHFLGLRHIWGDDDGCAGSDYVDDTPNQASSTRGCPTHPKTDACGEVIMFQNYLDYTDDNCMNLFTQGQISRVMTVLENSPRRKSLLTSPGLQEPVAVANDLGIRRIVFPDASVCANLITPVIELRNYGNNTITTARIRFVVDGNAVETKDFTLSMTPGATDQVTFSPLTIASGNHDISFQVLSTNGTTDGASYNDLKTSAIIVPFFGIAPFSEDFNATAGNWIVNNPDGQITWRLAPAPAIQPDNRALELNYFDYEDKVGEIDALLSPVFDLTSAPVATLTFEVAHARFQSSNDRLKVIVLTNCQALQDGTVVYNRAGDSLKTAPSTTVPFSPAGPDDWRKEIIDLTQFAGMQRVQIAFVGINDWGNNIFLDDIRLFTDENWDVALTDLVTPSIVTCTDQPVPVIRIRNTGSIALTGFDVDYSVNGGGTKTLHIDNLNVPVGDEALINLPPVNLTESENTLSIDLKNPNGFSDNDETNDHQTFTIVMNRSRDRIPLREDFETPFASDWTIVNPAGGTEWQTTGTNFGTSLYFDAWDNDASTGEAWLVSPVLDFSRVAQASMVFDLSYADRDSGTEQLTILVSTDCGNSYAPKGYSPVEAISSNTPWEPASEDDWKRNIVVDLTSVAGAPDVRVAFVVKDHGGNNLFLDNIEFFTTRHPDLIEIADLYSVYGYDLSDPEKTNLRITFNLPERQNVRYSLINVAGQMETDGMLTDVLNQTYPLNLHRRLQPGVYFIRVQIGGKFYTSKVLVF